MATKDTARTAAFRAAAVVVMDRVNLGDARPMRSTEPLAVAAGLSAARLNACIRYFDGCSAAYEKVSASLAKLATSCSTVARRRMH